LTKYSVQFDRSAEKELDRLETTLINRVLPKIRLLAENPRPVGCKKLQIDQNLWRIRVGDIRVVYSINDSSRVVTINRIKFRREAYR
jgi:mRNA interferase RelE/StbE